MHASTSVRGRTVSSRVSALMMECAEKGGLGPAEFCRRTGIVAADLADPAGRIDAACHRRAVELMASLPQQPLSGHEDNEALFDDFPLLGNLCLNAPNLREALAAFALCRPMVGEFDFLLARHADGIASIEYVAEFAPRNNFQALWNFHVLAALVRAYDVGIRTRFELELCGREPAGARELADIFGARPRFDCAANRMRFAAAGLDAPCANHNPAIAPRLLRQARQELGRIRRQGFAPVVEDLIRELIADVALDLQGALLLQRLCARLDISRWSLNRRLQQEGTNFRELEMKVRLEESRRLLADTELSVAEISDRVGFASHSAFTRFFRAQHGLAPTTFRRRMRNAAPMSAFPC